MKLLLSCIVLSLIVTITVAKCGFHGHADEGQPKCPDGWIRVGSRWEGQCVILQKQPLCWNKARELCRSLGGDLLSEPAYSVTILLPYLFLDNDLNDGTWIGKRRMPSNSSKSNQFLTLSGMDRRGQLSGELNWAPKQPSKNGDCVEILSKTSENPGAMAVAKCDQRKPFLCSKFIGTDRPRFSMEADCDMSDYVRIFGLISSLMFVFFSLKFVIKLMSTKNQTQYKK